MKRLPLFKLGALAIVLVLGGCSLPIVTLHDNSSTDTQPTVSSAATSSFLPMPDTPPIFYDVNGDRENDQLKRQRMHDLGVKTRIGTGSPDGDYRDYYLRFDVDGSIIDAATGEVVGRLDPVTKLGRWMLCAGKARVHCLELQSLGQTVHGMLHWELVGEYLDGKPYLTELHR